MDINHYQNITSYLKSNNLKFNDLYPITVHS